MRILVEYVEDDLVALRDLGLLVEADPRTWRHVPQPLDPAEAERVAGWLDRVRHEPKAQFR